MRHLLTIVAALWFVAPMAYAELPTVLDVVLFGDSLTTPHDWDAFTDPHYTMNEQAAGAGKCEDVVDDMTTFIADEYTAKGTPMDVVVILCGTNDAVNLVSVATSMGFFEAAAALAQAIDGVQLVVVMPPPLDVGGTTPLTSHVTRMAEIAAAQKAWAIANSVPYASAWDVFTAYDAEPPEMDDLLVADGVHMELAGMLLIGHTVQTALDQVQSRPPQRCP